MKTDPGTIREHIVTLCKENNVTQEELYIKIGAHETYLQRCVRLDTLPKTQFLIDVSDYFNTTVDYLLFGINKEREGYVSRNSLEKALDISCHKLSKLMYSFGNKNTKDFINMQYDIQADNLKQHFIYEANNG